MSKYTTELRYICETLAGKTASVDYTDVESVIEAARTKIFDFDYPIFDETYRKTLETKILKHYYVREIGQETIGLWKLTLNTKLNEIMPRFNRMYKAEVELINPFYDADYTEELTGSDESTNVGQNTDAKTGTDTSTRETFDNESGRVDYKGTTTEAKGTTTTRTDNLTETPATSVTSQDSLSDTVSTETKDVNVHWDTYSDTPQGAITNLDNNTYLTNARKITDDSDGSTQTVETEYGKRNVTSTAGTVTNTGTQAFANSGSDTTTRNTYDTTDKTNIGTDESATTYGSTNTRDSFANISSTNEYVKHVYGKMPGKSYFDLFSDFIERIIDIDMEVIESLEPCFFQLW